MHAGFDLIAATEELGHHRFVLRGKIGGATRRFLLRRGSNRIGSLPSSEICLAARGVSKRHAILAVENSCPCVEDLASKNGTYVNGMRVEAQELRPGDEIRVGSIKLQMECVAPDDGELAIRLGENPACSSEFRRETSRLSTRSRFGGSAWSSDSCPAGPSLHPFESLIFPQGHLPAKSLAMSSVYRQLAAVARTTLPILILGETGVGKEGIARCLHASSDRSSRPFLPLNCAAIPIDLLEAELFGIGKGVATGVHARPGAFQLAARGTLFLDEIGDMPLPMQTKLLRALQEKEIQPLGGSQQPSDVRIVAATNTEIERTMHGDGFRRDLYYRLAGLVLQIPPLRHRQDDIPSLVEYFLQAFCKETNLWTPGITVGALRYLVEHQWPGNIRELEHSVRRLVYLCPEGQAIDIELCRMATDIGEPTSSGEPTPPMIVEVAKTEPGNRFDPSNLANLDLEAIRKQIIREAMRRAEGNKTRAAGLLGLSREALRRRWIRMKSGS